MMTQKQAVRVKISNLVRPYVYIAPSILVFLTFMIYPVFYMIYLSFYKWDMMSEKIPIGIKNFTALFRDSDFLQVIWNTFYYMILTVTFTVLIALVMALLLKKDSRINRLLQGVVFLPYIISFVSVSFIWMWMMDSSFGLFNFLLNLLHLPSVNWLGDPKTAMISLVIVAIWKGVGYNSLIIISGMQSIPNYLYEAASLDKAKQTSVFFKITLPMLSPTLFFLILVNVIASLKVFEIISIMTKGGPSGSTRTLVYYLYEYGFGYYKIGYSSAVGVVLMLIIGILTIFYFKALSRKIHYR